MQIDKNQIETDGGCNRQPRLPVLGRGCFYAIQLEQCREGCPGACVIVDKKHLWHESCPTSDCRNGTAAVGHRLNRAEARVQQPRLGPPSFVEERLTHSWTTSLLILTTGRKLVNKIRELVNRTGSSEG